LGLFRKHGHRKLSILFSFCLLSEGFSRQIISRN
jgi:hypothetical protein